MGAFISAAVVAISCLGLPVYSEAKEADWRFYGPLKIDWANIIIMNDSRVMPTINRKGQSMYVAVNCDQAKINVTGQDGDWKEWVVPKEDFERHIIVGVCQSVDPDIVMKIFPESF